MKVLIMDDDGNEINLDIPDTIRVSFKTPDCIRRAVEDMGFERSQIDDNEMTTIMQEDLSKWIEYGELLTVEFNLREKTAKVVEVK